jgi:Apea-like HEPN
VSSEGLLASLIELSREDAAARAAGGDASYRYRRTEMRNSESYSRFTNAAAGESEALSRLMGGEYLSVATDSGSYATNPDGVYIVSGLLDDGLRLAESQEITDTGSRESALAGALEALLVALATGTSTTTHYFGLRGVSLSGTAAVDLGVGVLRPLDAAERRAFAMDGASSPGTTEGEVCLVTTSQVRWSVTAAPSEVPKQATPALTKTELLQALLILAEARNQQDQLRTAHVVWDRMTPYFHQGGSSGFGQSPDLQWRATDSIFNATVTAAVGEAARKLHPALVKVPPKEVGVFVRRFVSACLVYNATPEDRLIDAAVAWEALFGSRDHDQLTVQLSLAMAWMLAPEDYADRLKIYRRAKKIYATRSKLVHGGNASVTEIPAAATELTEWLREVFAALLTRHPSLLSESDRAVRVFLREPEEASQN